MRRVWCVLGFQGADDGLNNLLNGFYDSIDLMATKLDPLAGNVSDTTRYGEVNALLEHMHLFTKIWLCVLGSEGGRGHGIAARTNIA